MIFYNTEEKRYFTAELRYSCNMGITTKMLTFLLKDVLRELWEQKELTEMFLDTSSGTKSIIHTTRHGEERIVEQLREIAKSELYVVYKDGIQAKQ